MDNLVQTKFVFDTGGDAAALHCVVPTYHPVVHSGLKEYGDPLQPIHLLQADGLLLILGDLDVGPRLVIERRLHGWLIFIQPVVSGGEAGYLQMADDGRSCLCRDAYAGAVPKMMILEPGAPSPLDLD